MVGGIGGTTGNTREMYLRGSRDKPDVFFRHVGWGGKRFGKREPRAKGRVEGMILCTIRRRKFGAVEPDEQMDRTD